MSVADSTAEQIAARRRVALTTYDLSGEAVTTAVRVVLTADGRLGFCTAPGAAEAKRLHHDARVRMQPCDARGRTQDHSTVVEGQAELVRSGALFDEVRGRVREKYRWRARLGPHHVDRVVLVTLT